MSDHEALIARLEKLTEPATTKEVEDCIRHSPWYHDAPSHDPLWNEFCRALQGSLDAAVALTERLLPGAEFSLTNIYGLAMAEVPLNGPTTETGHHKGGSLPIALLIATLRAAPSSTPLHGEQS